MKMTGRWSAIARSMSAPLCAAFALVLGFSPQAASAQTGTITIIIDQEVDAQDFPFTSTSTSIPAFSLDDDTNAQLPDRRTFTLTAAPAGTLYVINQSAVPGWQFNGVTCTGGTAAIDVANRRASVTLRPNQNVRCVFRNQRMPRLAIKTDTVPNGPQDFVYTSLSSLIPSFTLDDDSNNTVPNSKTFSLPGGTSNAYTIIQNPVPGWRLVSIVCTGTESYRVGVVLSARSVTIPMGQKTTSYTACTFTNRPQ